jgi:MFS family permease
MTLWHGPISDAHGRRRVILVAVALFALASLGCIFATGIEQLWLLRVLQGMTAGVGMVVSRAIVGDLYHGAQAQRLIAQIMIMFAAASVIAPVLGGWLQTWFGWRAVFALLVLLSVALWLACWKFLPETPARTPAPVAARRLSGKGLLWRARLTILSADLRRAGLQLRRFLHLRVVGTGFPGPPPGGFGDRFPVAFRAGDGRSGAWRVLVPRARQALFSRPDDYRRLPDNGGCGDP